MVQSQVIVTLVHGTYAQGAEWIRAGPLCKKLAMRGAKTLPFEWTGENSIQARVLAGRKLAAHLKTIEAFNPNAKQIIVAHSHGGNIALYAANAMGKNHNLFGIVTLATPFLQAGVRSVTKGTSKSIQDAISGLFAFLIFCVGTFLHLAWVLRIVLLIPGIILGAFVGGYLAGSMMALTDSAQTIAESFKPKFSRKVDLFIIRIAGDEASMALATAQFLAWSSARLYSRMGRMQPKTVPESIRNAFRRRPAPAHFWPLFFVTAALLIFLDMALMYGGVRHEQLIVMLKVSGLVLVLIFLTAHTKWIDGGVLGVALLLVGTAKFLRTIWLGTYSSDPERGGPITRVYAALVLALLLDASTESTPTGQRWLIQLEQTTLGENEAAERLVHSAYEDPRVQDLVAEYVGRYLHAEYPLDDMDYQS